jgi:hypothetical protein
VAQAVARLRVPAVAPEERSELVTSMGMAGAGSEIGEQRLCLTSGQAQDPACAESSLKPTE